MGRQRREIQYEMDKRRRCLGWSRERVEVQLCFYTCVRTLIPLIKGAPSWNVKMPGSVCMSDL